MNKVYPLMLIAGALTLGGCLAEQEENRQLGSADDQREGSTQQDTAKVTFSAKLPDGPHAAYIDPKTQIIRVQVRESSIAGFDVEEDGAEEVYREYKECQRAQAHSVTSSIAQIDCGPPPGSNQFPLVDEGNLTAGESSIGFNLRPDTKYRFSAALYKSKGDRLSNKPFAWATTFAKLEEGENAVELNLLYGSWTFDNEPEFQLLHRSTADLGIEGIPSDFDWSIDENESYPSVAIALGLASEVDESVRLKALHLRDYPRFTTGNTSYPPPQALASLENEWLFDKYPIGVLVPHDPLLETTSERLLGEGFEMDEVFNLDGYDSVGFERGLFLPATLMQQYDPSQPVGQRNRHALNLGDWEVIKFLETEDPEPEQIHIEDFYAGFFFYNVLEDFFNRLQEQGVEDGQITLDGVNIRDENPPGFLPVLPDLTIARLDVENFTTSFSLQEGTDDFSALLDALPSQMDSPSTIESTLIEFTGRLQITEDTDPAEVTPPTFDEDGNLVEASAATVSAASKSNRQEVRKRRTEQLKARIRHQLQMNLVNELINGGQVAAANTGCFVETFELEYTDDVMYQLVDGVWKPGDPVNGFWVIDSAGEPVRDQNGDIVTFDESEWSELDSFIEGDDEADDYVDGIIRLSFAEDDDFGGYYYGFHEEEQGQTHICMQSVTLTAGPYSNPEETSEVDGIVQ